MATPSTSHVPSDPALTGPWENYRTWAATARYHKNALDLLSKWSLLLAIGGAILATLGQQIVPFAPKLGLGSLLFKLPGVLGSGAIALVRISLRRRSLATVRESGFAAVRRRNL